MKLAAEPGEDAQAQALDAVTAYTQTFNKMGFIETEERDEIYMGHRMTQDRTIYRYDVHNQCKNCGRYYRVDIEDTAKQRFPCPPCGLSLLWDNHAGRGTQDGGGFLLWWRRFRAARTPGSAWNCGF